MLDDDVGTMMDDDEEENEKAPPAKVETAGTEKKSFSLPLDDASDDWMLDDDVGTMIDEEEDSKEKKEDSAPPKAPEAEKKEAEKKSFSLPLDDASDDWMLDDDVGTMTMEDEEEPKSSKEEHANVEDKK